MCVKEIHRSKCLGGGTDVCVKETYGSNREVSRFLLNIASALSVIAPLSQQST